jgi:hypothetical protein
MRQQDTTAGPDPRPPPDAAPPERACVQRPPDADADSTWGQGSATALEYLRRHDYRGRRGRAAPDRPRSE